MKFEEQFKANAIGIVPVDPDKPHGQPSMEIKKDEIGELRTIGAFFSWFASWEFKNVLTWPFIYGMIFPLLSLELFAWVFQSVCFPIYGIRKVRRSDYFHVKPHKLGYLNVAENMNATSAF